MKYKAGDIREDENGKKFVWKITSNGEEGYWSQIEDEELSSFRIPLTCPSCTFLLDNWSVSFYNRWGVCSHCYHDFIEQRSNLPEFKSNKERAEYCKQKFGEIHKIK